MLTIDFINVGYGDAILIRDIDTSFSMLIDCGDVNTGEGGPNSKRISAADFLVRENIKTLDLLVLTHLHLDHSGGLLDVLKIAQVKEFWTNYLPPEQMWGKKVECTAQVSPAADCLLKSLNIYSSALNVMKLSGTIIKQIDDQSQVKLTSNLLADIFIEIGALQEKQKKVCDSVFEGIIDERLINNWDCFINDTSIRLRLTYSNKKIELPGDMYAKCWERHEIPSCDIVKIPHHGHCDSMTEKLADMLNPKYAVISVSNTRIDNCPSVEVLNLLRKKETQVFFTDSVQIQDIEPNNQYSVRFVISKQEQIDIERVKQ